MANFAQLDKNNIVVNVIVVNDEAIDDVPFPESELLGVAFLQDLFGHDTVWKQTSYNNSFRARYAGIDYSYDETLDVFLQPKPYPDWVLEPHTTEWIPPIPYPIDGNTYIWSQPLHTWVKVNPDTGLPDGVPDYEII
jgi:hypothetical protein